MNIDVSLSAAHHMAGIMLPNGWKVIEKVKRLPGATGGHFSIGYLVQKDEQIGFLKALNILAMIQNGGQSLIDLLAEVSTAHKYERDLFLLCQNRHLSKVSILLDHGEITIPGYVFSQVPYLIFERADGDARSILEFGDNIDTAWKLKSLHNVAAGLSQLHRIDVAHQDLKPSNVFVYNKTTSKIGDLGRSLSKEIEAPHKDIDFPGDLDYSPPEVWYGYLIPEWNARVFSIDLYLLGSLIAFYFTGLNMSALISKHLDDQFHFSKGHSFKEVSPYLVEAFCKAIDELASNIPFKGLAESLTQLVKELCYPIPEKRGDPKTLLSRYNPYDLQRVIQKLNVLQRKVEYRIIN